MEGAVADKFPFAKYFGEVNILAALQFEPGPRPFFGRPPAEPEPKDLLLYLGCNVLRTAHLAKTIIDVLKAMGFEFNTVGGPENCCGIIHHNNGEPRGARAYSAHTLGNFARYQPRQVLMWCPSCNEHFDGAVTQEQAVAFPYQHVTAFVADHLDRLSFVRRVERRVALHYHTGHPQQDQDWACTRAILKSIPGLGIRRDRESSRARAPLQRHLHQPGGPDGLARARHRHLRPGGRGRRRRAGDGVSLLPA